MNGRFEASAPWPVEQAGRPRVLLLTLYFQPDVAANAVIMTQLAQQLRRLGYGVTVVSSVPHYAAQASSGRCWVQHEWTADGLHVVRTAVHASGRKASMVDRVLNYLSFHVLSTLVGCRLRGQFDVVLAPSPPLSIGLSAWLVSRVAGVPYVYNVQDIYPDIAVKLGLVQNGLAVRALSWLEGFVYRGAAAVSVLSDGARANLRGKGVPEDKLRVIPNFVDAAFVRPLPRRGNAFSVAHGLDNCFVALYAGNVGYSQDLSTLLRAAAQLRDVRELVVLVVGNGASKARLEREAVEQGLANVRFLPFQPRECLPELYASCDVGLVPLLPGIGSESIPSKALTIMASGRPVLAAVEDGSETHTLLTEAGAGVRVAPGDAGALADALRRLYDDREGRERMGAAGRSYVERHFTPERAGLAYAELLSGVAAGAGGRRPSLARSAG